MLRQSYQLIKIICPFCCRVMLTQQERDQLKQKADRFLSGLVAQTTFNFVVKQAKSKRLCPHSDCQMPQPKYELDGGMIYWRWELPYDIDMMRRTGWGELLERPFTAREALSIFENVPKEDWRLLGFQAEKSHPAWTIYSCVAVLPNCLRPTDKSRNQQHDITLLGEEIVRKVSLLKRSLLEIIPAWVPRSVHALNAWLDEALETLLSHDLSLAEHEETSLDAPNIVTFATMMAQEAQDVAMHQAQINQTVPVAKQKKPARAQVRRQTKVSFLQTALCAVEGAMQA